MSFRYFKDVLPNRLRVVTVETPHLHTALIAVYVRVGSRHERPHNNGVSHFLEHLFFRGSARYPDTVAMNALVEEAGGNLNGVTTRDHSYYYTPIHPAHLETAASVLGDMLARPLLRQLEIERQVILEEMLDEVDERGRDIDVDNLSKAALFGSHPLALKIAGTRRSVKRLSLDQVKAHLWRFYVARNMVLTVVGDVKRREVLSLARRHFGALRPGRPTREAAPARAPAGPWLRFIRHDESQTEFRLNFRVPPERHPDHAAMQILRRVLDDGLSSRLPYNVVERKGLAYSIHAALESFDDVGLFEVDAASAPDKAGAVLAEIASTLAELRERGPTDEEIDRAKRRHRMLLEFAADSPGELAGYFGATELFFPPEPFEERCAQVERQTPERIRQVARRYLAPSNLGVVAVGQRSSAAALQRALRRA